MMPMFKFSETDEIPKFHKLIYCHMVFDIKLSNLACKARFVAGGHQTDPPKDTTYSSVILRDSVWIAFLAATLNDLNVLTANVQNAYLNAPTSEKVYTIAGLEFGASNVGRPIRIASSSALWPEEFRGPLAGPYGIIPQGRWICKLQGRP